MNLITQSSIPIEEEIKIIISSKGTFVYKHKKLRTNNINGFPIIVTDHEMAFINAFIGIDLNIWIARGNFFTKDNGIYSI